MTQPARSTLRVLHVSHTSLVSGAEHSLLDLMAGLQGRAQPQLASPPGELSRRASALGVDTVAIRPVDLTFKRSARAAVAALRDTGGASRDLARVTDGRVCDVVHANSVRASLLAGPVARARRVPLVMHVRDVLPHTSAGTAVRRLAAGMATHIVAISQYVSDAYTEGLPLGLARKVTVVDNPIDLQRFKPRGDQQRRAARSALGVQDERPVLAIVGQITPWKGHDVAVRAFADVCRAQPQALLLVIGEVKFASSATTLDNAAFRRELDDLAARLALPPDSVRFLGERHDVPDLLAGTDLLLAPSQVEPFGRSIAEAMAVGVPVIASEIGGPPEYVADGHTGWLLDPRDADAWGVLASEVLSDHHRTRSIAADGRDAVRARFSRERHANAMLEVLAQASRRRRPAARLPAASRI